eukprot:m.338655 g.338655  ORF g.338655 m.338655 type:complete len:184 (+) comp18494_c0_seq1:421-972(+)
MKKRSVLLEPTTTTTINTTFKHRSCKTSKRNKQILNKIKKNSKTKTTINLLNMKSNTATTRVASTRAAGKRRLIHKEQRSPSPSLYSSVNLSPIVNVRDSLQSEEQIRISFRSSPDISSASSIQEQSSSTNQQHLYLLPTTLTSPPCQKDLYIEAKRSRRRTNTAAMETEELGIIHPRKLCFS